MPAQEVVSAQAAGSYWARVMRGRGVATYAHTHALDACRAWADGLGREITKAEREAFLDGFLKGYSRAA